VMDEAAIVVGFKSGDIVLVGRRTLTIEKTIKTHLSRMHKLAVSPNYIFAGNSRNDRFYNPGSPSVCIYQKESGTLAHTLSFQGGLSINQILPAFDNYAIISHSSYSNTDTAFTTCLSVYKLNEIILSGVSVDTDPQYTLPGRNLSKFSLSRCKRKFLVTESAESHTLTVVDIVHGKEDFVMHVAPPDRARVVWTKQDFGFLTNDLIFILWTSSDEFDNFMYLLGSGSVLQSVRLNECFWNTRFGLASNHQQILGVEIQDTTYTRLLGHSVCERYGGILALSKSGLVRKLTLKGSKNKKILEYIADPTSLVGYFRDNEKQGLVIWDFA